MREANGLASVKVVMIGSASSGKTSLSTQFAYGRFSHSSEPTIGAAYFTKEIDTKDGSLKLDIWDTAGSEKYKSLAKMYYQGARAAIVVVDLTNELSLTEATDWITEFREKGQEGTFVVMAANKSDLTQERNITHADIDTFVHENNVRLAMETSALTGAGVRELFEEMACIILQETAVRTVEETNCVRLSDAPLNTSSKEGKCSC